MVISKVNLPPLKCLTPQPYYPTLPHQALIKSETISDKHLPSSLIDFRALHVAYTQHFYANGKYYL